MRKIAQVPIQIWRGWDPNVLFGGWFSALGGFKPYRGNGSCPESLIPPCLVPQVLQPIRTIIESTKERKMAAHMIML
jgi:hypothetical protein